MSRTGPLPPFTEVATSAALPSRDHPSYIGVTVHDCRTLSNKPLNMSQVLLVSRVRSKLLRSGDCSAFT